MATLVDKQLAVYKAKMNEIDDFFEYQFRNYSVDDTQSFIYDVLNSLTEQLKGLKADEGEGNEHF